MTFDRAVALDRLVTLTGGKRTTYRAMAADTVDEVEAVLARRRVPSRTAGLRLRGARRLSSGHDHLSEAVYAARYEMACTVDDVLARRTRSLILARNASIAAAPDVARLLAPDLGWDDAERAPQMQAYRAAANAA